MQKRFLSYILLAVVLFWGISDAKATHIRAADITAIRLGSSPNGITYRVIITAYTDRGAPAQVKFGNGVLSFGDGSDPIIRPREQFTISGGVGTPRPGGDPRAVSLIEEFDTLGNDVEFNQIIFEHTFAAGFAAFRISYQEPNRNEGILNMSNSVNTPFYVETIVRLDDFLGPNNTPRFTIPPIDFGCTFEVFEHNPGAFDVDGDSLAYRLVIPQQDINVEVGAYRFPNEPPLSESQDDGSVPPIFNIDQEGLVTWNSPGLEGEYNIAFVVEEWRVLEIQGERIPNFLGSVVRDMQIIVEICENDPPEIQVPDDTCILAGTNLVDIITATDPNNDAVLIEGFNGPFEVNPTATLQPLGIFQPTPATSLFEWNTDCFNVRRSAYEAVFKATDNGVPNLVDFDTWAINVIAPAPVLDTAMVLPGNRIELQWQPYADCPNASGIQVWRRIDSFDFDPSGCNVGIPDGSGYELITTLPVMEGGDFVTSFIDDDNGELLNFGANYCYRLVAVFPEPTGGESYASNEKCGAIAADVPIITNVTVIETSDSEGRVQVRWIPPLDVDTLEVRPPFRYQLIRNEGLTSSASGQLLPAEPTLDTLFEDTGLNTEFNAYNYQVILFGSDLNGNLISTPADTGDAASSVLLQPNPQASSIELSWQAEVPWTNASQRFPSHFIFRDNVNPSSPEQLVLIDSANVINNGFEYVDDGRFNNTPLSDQIEYCYFVTTVGTYGNDEIPALDNLRNNSQIVCLTPNDTIAPCPPIFFAFEPGQLIDCEQDDFVGNTPCNQNVFETTLQWEIDDRAACVDEINFFNIYFSLTGREGTYELLDQVSGSTSFTHIRDDRSLAGCYRISSVDRAGNESELSEPLCRDNCPNYQLPNIFTPGGDNCNDLFQAFHEPPAGEPLCGGGTGGGEGGDLVDFRDVCPRFVEYVNFTVVNRWGRVVFDYDSRNADPSSGLDPILINWNGKDNEGTDLPTGVYYYTAEVKFVVLNPDESVRTFKSWVHLLRDTTNPPE
jgi:hypothetical protein